MTLRAKTSLQTVQIRVGSLKPICTCLKVYSVQEYWTFACNKLEHLANNTGANRMHRLVCVYVFRTEQSQVFSWRGIGGIKGDLHAQIQRGDRWSDLPSGKSQKNIGFLSNTGPDPLKNHKATKPAFNIGIIHVFHALIFAGSRGCCLNTRLIG